jgi:hypothetical protein
MNMAYLAYTLDQDRSYEFQNDEPTVSSGRERIQRKSQPSYARKRSPSAHNGIHRRRNKRFAW